MTDGEPEPPLDREQGSVRQGPVPWGPLVRIEPIDHERASRCSPAARPRVDVSNWLLGRRHLAPRVLGANLLGLALVVMIGVGI